MDAVARALERADRALAGGWRWPLILFAIALVLKLAYVLQSADALHVRVPIMDSKYYDQMAQDIAAGRIVRKEAFFMGPLYPYFLALVYSTFGRDFMLVRILQVVAGAATVMLAFQLGRRVFRPSAALAGAVLLILYGAMTFYESELLMEWMVALLDCAALLLLVRGRDTASVRDHALAGALFGLSALARASILIFALALLVWMLLRRSRRRAQALAFGAAVAIVLAPAVVHNYLASRVLLPVTSNAGVNFYIGNGAAATGIFVPIRDVDVIDDVTTRDFVERQTGRAMNPAEVSAYWFQRSFDEMGAAPAHTLVLFARKIALFFNGYEIPQIESFDTQRRELPWLRALFVPLWFIMVFGIIGMVLALRAGRAGLLAAFVLGYALSIIVFFVTGRYRVPVAPVLCLFAGSALVAVPDLLRVPRARGALAVAVAMLVLATSPGIFRIDPSMIEFREQVRRARRLSELGSHAPALRAAARAIEIYPREPEGYIQRAIVQGQAGDEFKAIEDYQRALEIDPAQPSVHYDLAQALRRVNLRREAVREYAIATQYDPGMAQAWNNMGVTYKDMGKADEAIAAFRKAIEVAPRYVRAYNNLGACFAELGRVEEAIATFQETTRRFPDYATGYRNLAMAYASQRQARPALEAMRRYAELNPSDLEAVEAIRKLEIVVRADSARGGD